MAGQAEAMAGQAEASASEALNHKELVAIPQNKKGCRHNLRQPATR